MLLLGANDWSTHGVVITHGKDRNKIALGAETEHDLHMSQTNQNCYFWSNLYFPFIHMRVLKHLDDGSSKTNINVIIESVEKIWLVINFKKPNR